MKSKLILSILAALVVLIFAGVAGAVTLAWDKDAETWTADTQVAILVRTDPAGAPSQIPDRYPALAAVGVVNDGYFEPGKTYYLTAVAIENGQASEESNQVELTPPDPLGKIPVMILRPIPGGTVLSISQ